jgi:GTPase SAR1 family protein
MVFNEVSEEEIQVIRTLECDLCMRFDSIMITRDEIEHRVNSNSLQIGSHLISHGDHLRIVYFDHFGMYLGDTISLNTSKTKLELFNRELPILPRTKPGIKRRLQKYMLSRFISSPLNLCIVGPSFAGKTSLTLYLETGTPERYSKRINHSPTMGRSIKRFKLGRSKLTVFDMGGQRDFWPGWEEKIALSERIIFVLDGTANNTKDIRDALDLVLDVRARKSIPILILLNKMDLFVDGYTNNFSSIGEFLPAENTIKLDQVWTVETSVFNGICYNYGGKAEETSLAQVIADFMDI